MTQKNNENIYKALKEEERTLSEKNFVWMKKPSKEKKTMQHLEIWVVNLYFAKVNILPTLKAFG